MIVRCILVDVYRVSAAEDFTNNGISSRFKSLLVACPDGHIYFDSEKESPLNFCMVEKRTFFGSVHTCVVPAAVNERGEIVKRPGWWMNGGNIANTCDSRLRELKGHFYPLCIHDRREF